MFFLMTAAGRFQRERRQFLPRQTRTRLTKMPALIAILLCAGLLIIPEKAFSEVPRGVFCLLPSGKVGKARTFTNPDIEGISIRQDWSELEPREGVFDWTYLDSMVAKSAAGNKKVLLRIGTGGTKPNWVTNAIENAGGKFFTFRSNGVLTTIPVFWDPTYLAKKKAMIKKLGAHFATHPSIKIVAASFANANSEDWGVPHDSQEVEKWLALGYTSEKMLDAGKQIIDTTMIAFPKQYVTLAVGGNGHVGADAGPNLDPDRDYVARNAVERARAFWPGRLIVQKNTLSATTAPAPGRDNLFHMLWKSRPDVAAQMLCWSYDDASYRLNDGVPDNPGAILRKAVDRGKGYEMKYIEIYHTDVLNLPSAISYARAALNAGGG